jgi:hypothetical protein
MTKQDLSATDQQILNEVSAEQRERAAELLLRIRHIEADCRAQHGEWDWEKLSPAEQDEYDAACIDLDELRFGHSPTLSLSDLTAEKERV